MAKIDDKKNSQAYRDCLDRSGPSAPDDADYMRCYRFWIQLANDPEDHYEPY